MRAALLLVMVRATQSLAPSAMAARNLLGAYDAGHQRAAKEGGKGMGGALSANEWALTADKPQLSEAARTLAAHADRVMLGFCADSAHAGVDALKCWVEALGLPRGTLHGMDASGVPLDMSTFGSVYIKYNSWSAGSNNPPGSAMLSGYSGDFRGVYFSPDLSDESFHQFGVLPLDLFGSETDAAAKPSATPSAASAVSTPAVPRQNQSGLAVLAEKLAGEAVSELTLDLQKMGASLRLVSATPDGTVTVAYGGPARLKAGIDVALRSSKLAAVKDVVFASSD
ncbi:hypothetical protein T492DRAFT_943491 [Pavlovales sp. CCMP2436]|nr:hypothetical protein T492DRAFT_943491 [Pavlovales sp. CCMP2436]|mmetsp:Transcript_28115/g.70762  ORF Transcript_28115/g.70762 Transcript_28115/m.70762 type:complete len:283 (-) Transcript_28115:58-906(-)